MDIALVVRNWLFGWYIVEFEKGGTDRAEYGSKLLKRLSQLKIKGCSERGLALYCKFYNDYSEISQTLSAKSEILAKILNVHKSASWLIWKLSNAKVRPEPVIM